MRFSLATPALETISTAWRWTVNGVVTALLLVLPLTAAAQVSSDHVSTVILIGIFLFGYLFVCALVHELGHAVAAWLVRWRVHLIVVGRRAFAPRRRKFLKVSDHPQQDIIGWVLATPPPGAEWTKGYIPFVLGGAAGNLVFGVLSLAIAAAAYKSHSNLFAATVLFGEMSLIYAVANLIPTWRPGHWQNDGARVIGALLGKELTSHEKATTRLYGMFFDGTPVDEWDQTALRELASGPQSEGEEIEPLLFHYAFTSGDLAAAKLILERLFEGKAEAPLDLRCNYAFILAVMDHDARRACEILDELSGEDAQTLFSYWRARSAAEHLSNRRELALKAIHKARALFESLAVQPDEDDEAIFQAIERNEALPPIQPRAGLSLQALLA